jgi:hypothetical protein
MGRDRLEVQRSCQFHFGANGRSIVADNAKIHAALAIAIEPLLHPGKVLQAIDRSVGWGKTAVAEPRPNAAVDQRRRLDLRILAVAQSLPTFCQGALSRRPRG